MDDSSSRALQADSFKSADAAGTLATMAPEAEGEGGESQLFPSELVIAMCKHVLAFRS